MNPLPHSPRVARFLLLWTAFTLLAAVVTVFIGWLSSAGHDLAALRFLVDQGASMDTIISLQRLAAVAEPPEWAPWLIPAAGWLAAAVVVGMEWCHEVARDVSALG